MFRGAPSKACIHPCGRLSVRPIGLSRLALVTMRAAPGCVRGAWPGAVLLALLPTRFGLLAYPVRVVWRVWSWIRPPPDWLCRFGCLLSASPAWAREGALRCWVSIGKVFSSLVVRPSHWDCRPGGGRRMSAVVLR